MGIQVLDPSMAGVQLMELTKLAAMMAGAVSGALVAWLARRNVLLALWAFLLGIMGGMTIGTGAGNLFFVTTDGAETIVKAGCCSVLPALGAGLAGALPSAFLISVFIGILALRHLHPRPPRVRTALKGLIAGVVMGTLTAVLWVVL
ncbi:MAG: hypothetical protein WCI95_06200 [bacterium]